MAKQVDSDKTILGRGGYGKVYYLEHEPKVAYKKSYMECNDLKKEFTNWNIAYQKYIEYTNVHTKFQTLGQILEPSNWQLNNSSSCVFQMPRIFSPQGIYSWQAYIGEVDNPGLDYLKMNDDHIRGRYMGPDTLSKNFNVLTLAYTSGVLVGIVQYGARLDGLDVELIVGTVDSVNKLFLLDFDQTNKWETPANETEEQGLIGKLSWPLIAEPYFPNIDSKYHGEFIKGYYNAAYFFGYKELAEKVIKDMVEI